MLGLVTVASIIAAFWLEPIPQDPAYHAFVDQRTLSAIPNFWNVVSNLPFLVVGLLGLAWRRQLQSAALRAPYVVFCVGVALVGFGSSYYHWAPSTPTLAWDRLPMAVAFMALFSAALQDRVSERLGRVLLWPLVFAGVATIAYWHLSELADRGDLRPYAVVQLLPMILVPMMLLLAGGRGLRDGWLWAAFAAYALAKLAEHFDAVIFAASGVLSGHSLKHLLAALAAWWVTRAFLGSAAAKLRTST